MKTLLGILLAGVTLAAHGPKQSPIHTQTVPVLSLAASAWQTFAVDYVPVLTNDATGALRLEIPQGEDYGPSVNYLFSPVPRTNIDGAAAITLTVAIETTGVPVFHFVFNPNNVCQTPAAIHPFLWAHRQDDRGEFSCWWANPQRIVFADGEMTLTVPLDPAAWSSVYGKFGTATQKSLSGWHHALQHISSLGMTFGGGCFFGHGVNVSGGTATLVVRQYQVS